MSANEKVWVNLSLTRGIVRGANKNVAGLVLRVEAASEVEDYMQAQSGSEKADVSKFGNMWIGLDTETALSAYIIPKTLIMPGMQPSYTVDYPGKALLVDSRGLGVASVANLSFLRLVGISKPGGLAFGVTGAYTKDYAVQLYRTLTKEIRSFLEDAIVPTELSLRFTSTVG